MHFKDLPVNVTKRIVRKWLKALRGGRYKQTTGQLMRSKTVDRDGYCCLGVLARVCGVPRSELDGRSYLVTDISFDGDVPTREYRLLGSEVQTALATINDQGDTKFAQVANFIEEYVLPEAKGR